MKLQDELFKNCYHLQLFYVTQNCFHIMKDKIKHVQASIHCHLSFKHLLRDFHF